MSESTHWCPDCVQKKKTKSERISELEKKVAELEAQLTQHKLSPHWTPYYPWWNWNYPFYPGFYFNTIPCGTGTGTLTTGGTHNLAQNTAGWTTTALSGSVVTDPGVPHV